VLIANDMTALDSCKQKINKEHARIQVKTLQHNFSKDFTAEALNKMWQNANLDKLDISILVVNNDCANIGRWIEVNESKIHDTIAHGCYPSVLLAEIAI
jgi:short-subunit dehydrogenase